MTFSDAINTNPTFTDLPAETIELAFVSRGLESSDDYTPAGLKDLELVTADLYLEIATQPKIREGGLSLEYNPAILLARARQIYLKYEDPKASEAGGYKLNLNITKS